MISKYQVLGLGLRFSRLLGLVAAKGCGLEVILLASVALRLSGVRVTQPSAAGGTWELMEMTPHGKSELVLSWINTKLTVQATVRAAS